MEKNYKELSLYDEHYLYKVGMDDYFNPATDGSALISALNVAEKNRLEKEKQENLNHLNKSNDY